MICPSCKAECKRNGYDRKGSQRYQCRQCKKTYLQERKRHLNGMTLDPEKAITILKLLVEGCSVRSIERLTGVHRDTVLRLLVMIGDRCEKLMGRTIVNVRVKDVECDEIWAFVKCKEKNKPKSQQNDETIGDAYCFVAIERSSKLILNFALGRRNKATTDIFIEGLRHATAHQQFQITTDGFPAYRYSISDTLHDRCDFATLTKVYRAPAEGEARYSPSEIASVEVVPVMGRPDPERICTSIIERQNLTIRIQMRRLTRFTNAFSKKWENLWAAYCLHFACTTFAVCIGR